MVRSFNTLLIFYRKIQKVKLKFPLFYLRNKEIQHKIDKKAGILKKSLVYPFSTSIILLPTPNLLNIEPRFKFRLIYQNRTIITRVNHHSRPSRSDIKLSNAYPPNVGRVAQREKKFNQFYCLIIILGYKRNSKLSKVK